MGDTLAAREEPARGLGEGEERAVPSVLEMVEEMSGEDEGIGLRVNMLLRPPPKEPASPMLKACPVVIKKIKMQRPWAPSAEEHSMLHPYNQGKLVSIGIQVCRSL